MAAVFAIVCENRACPYEPTDGFRYATMPDVGSDLHARPPIHCTCGLQVQLLHQVEE